MLKKKKAVKYYSVIKPNGEFNINRIFDNKEDAEKDIIYVALGYEVYRSLDDNTEKKKAMLKVLGEMGYYVSELLIKVYP